MPQLETPEEPRHLEYKKPPLVATREGPRKAMKTWCSKGRTKPNSARNLPGSPVVKTSHFPCRGHRFDPWSGNKDPTCCVAWRKKKKKVALGLWRELYTHMSCFHYDSQLAGKWQTGAPSCSMFQAMKGEKLTGIRTGKGLGRGGKSLPGGGHSLGDGETIWPEGPTALCPFHRPLGAG